jgi:hypothetical protein
MHTSLIAPRVVLRHGDLVPDVTRVMDSIPVILADGGTVTATDIVRLLGDRLGSLVGMRFVQLAGVRSGVRWKARDQRGHVVSGWLLLHAGIRGDEAVVTWAEIVIDQRWDDLRHARVSEGSAEDRLDEVARRARGLIRDLREGRHLLPEAVAALVGIVDLSEHNQGDVEPEAQPPKSAARYDRRADGGGDVGRLERRLERVAQRGRDLLQRMRGEPTFSHGDVVRAVARLVAEAER